MAELAINKQTKHQLDKFLKSPSQALMVMGAIGGGQDYIARLATAGLLNCSVDELDNQPNLISIEKPADKKEIPIELVRELISRLRIKSAQTRVVLITQADKMTHEAQNALLKVLEEPNANTHFVLSVSQAMLATAMSRAQKVTAYPISLAEARQHYSDFADKEVESAWNISEGSAGTLDQILRAGNESAEKSAISVAKQFMSANRYQRVIMIDEISKNRELALDFLEALTKVLKALHHAQIKRDGQAKLKAFIASRKAIEKSRTSIAANGSVKLALLSLVVNLTV
jgi:DNA polymerase III delta prime subunit